jgi:hypothetical protein
MRFFQEINVDPHCYVIDAVEWIVRGIPPQLELTNDGENIRGGLNAYLRAYSLEVEPLNQTELTCFEASLSYDEYLDLRYGSLGQEEYKIHDTFEARNSNAATDEQLGEWTENSYQELTANESRRSELLLRNLPQYYHEVERAKSKVMNALITGALSLSGYWAESEDSFHDLVNEGTAKPTTVPSAEISPSNYDWKLNTLKTIPNQTKGKAAGSYYLLTLQTSEMLKAFDAPKGLSSPMFVFNNNAYLDDGEASEALSSSRSRGRPYKTDWLKPAMRAWYEQQISKGVLGQGKFEADVAAAQEWALSLGKNISRSSIQNYLHGLAKPKGR